MSKTILSPQLNSLSTQMNSLLTQPNSLLTQPNSLSTQPNSLLTQLNSLSTQPNLSIIPLQQPNFVLPQNQISNSTPSYKGYVFALLIGTMLELKTVIIMILIGLIIQNEKLPIFLTQGREITPQELIARTIQQFWLFIFNIIVNSKFPNKT